MTPKVLIKRGGMMKLDKAFYILTITLCLFMVVLCGCAGITNKDEGQQAMLEPQAVLKFNDIPVPAGFKADLKDSYSFESNGLRVGLLKYTGSASPDQVVNFYKEQMLMYNWNLLNIVEYGQRLLNFDRETETCVITLMPRGSGSEITIALGPKSQQMPKKSSKPFK